MNETLKKVLKFFSRSLGFFFINSAIILILFAFFTYSSINNLDSLKTSLQNSVQKQISNLSYNGITIEEYCKINRQDENCKQISSLSNNPEIDQAFNNVKAYQSYTSSAIFAAIILFFLGFMFVYLGTFSLLNAGYKVSFNIAINSFLGAIYFNFLPNIIKAVLNTSRFQELTREVPKEYVNEITNVILTWIKIPVSATFKLSLVIGGIFLVIAIILKIEQKKRLKITK